MSGFKTVCRNGLTSAPFLWEPVRQALVLYACYNSQSDETISGILYMFLGLLYLNIVTWTLPKVISMSLSWLYIAQQQISNGHYRFMVWRNNLLRSTFSPAGCGSREAGWLVNPFYTSAFDLRIYLTRTALFYNVFYLTSSGIEPGLPHTMVLHIWLITETDVLISKAQPHDLSFWKLAVKHISASPINPQEEIYILPVWTFL